MRSQRNFSSAATCLTARKIYLVVAPVAMIFMLGNILSIMRSEPAFSNSLHTNFGLQPDVALEPEFSKAGDACGLITSHHPLLTSPEFSRFRWQLPLKDLGPGRLIDYNHSDWRFARQAHAQNSGPAYPEGELRVDAMFVKAFLNAVPAAHRQLPRFVLSFTTTPKRYLASFSPLPPHPSATSLRPLLYHHTQALPRFVLSFTTTQALPRFVLSFTTTPKRLLALADVITPLKQMKLKFDTIYLALPHTLARSGEVYNVPEWLTTEPSVTLLRPDRDLGPATKLLPALQAELTVGRLDTRILVIDDDMRVSELEMLHMLLHSLIFPNAAVTREGWQTSCFPIVVPGHYLGKCSAWSGNYRMWVRRSQASACSDFRFQYSFLHCTRAVQRHCSSKTDVLTGFSGFLVQPRFFLEGLDVEGGKHADVFSVDMVDEKAVMFADDPWISGWLQHNRVARLVFDWDHKDIETAWRGTWFDQALRDKIGKHALRDKIGKHEDSNAVPDTIAGIDSGIDGLHDTYKDRMESSNRLVISWFQKHGIFSPDHECYSCPRDFYDTLCAPPRPLSELPNYDPS
eukprot:g58893.t1